MAAVLRLCSPATSECYQHHKLRNQNDHEQILPPIRGHTKAGPGICLCKWLNLAAAYDSSALVQRFCIAMTERSLSRKTEFPSPLWPSAAASMLPK